MRKAAQVRITVLWPRFVLPTKKKPRQRMSGMNQNGALFMVMKLHLHCRRRSRSNDGCALNNTRLAIFSHYSVPGHIQTDDQHQFAPPHSQRRDPSGLCGRNSLDLWLNRERFGMLAHHHFPTRFSAAPRPRFALRTLAATLVTHYIVDLRAILAQSSPNWCIVL